MVNLTAVTTVVLIRAESDTSDSCNLGNKFAGSIRVSFPRHSATTFRVPSSPHSQCRNNCCQIAGTNGCSNCTPPGVNDWHEIICNKIPPFCYSNSFWACSQLASSCLFIRLSGHPHGTTCLPLDGFSRNFVFEYFSKTCQENSCFIKI
jgi:hypothetical protein